MQAGIVVGFISGMVIGLVVLFFILKATKTDGKIKCKYDERQKMARGKAYEMGFWTLIGYNVLYGLYGTVVNQPIFDSMSAMMIGICLAITVQVVYCIWHDAYISLNEDKRKVFVAFGFLGLINIAIGVTNILNGSWIDEGVINSRILNLIAGSVFVIIFIAYIAKQIHSKKEME